MEKSDFLFVHPFTSICKTALAARIWASSQATVTKLNLMKLWTHKYFWKCSSHSIFWLIDWWKDWRSECWLTLQFRFEGFLASVLNFSSKHSFSNKLFCKMIDSYAERKFLCAVTRVEYYLYFSLNFKGLFSAVDSIAADSMFGKIIFTINILEPLKVQTRVQGVSLKTFDST